LDSLLPKADIIALSLPGNDETNGIITKDRLLNMKKSAILLNVGRGSALNTNALYEVLKDGHLLGAGLDVTDPEPLPPDHSLENKVDFKTGYRKTTPQ
jgi:phosphoglycerate dehydrogenase-like enzyme